MLLILFLLAVYLFLFVIIFAMPLYDNSTHLYIFNNYLQKYNIQL